MEDKEIITYIKMKNENAAELFIYKYGPLIRYIIAPFLNNNQDMEECINDIVLKVCDKIDMFDSEKGSWNAWITAIARNTALNMVRAKKDDGKLIVAFDADETLQIRSSELSPEEILVNKERQRIVIEAIQSLAYREKLIFYRKYYYQQSTAQIAAELGLTERSVEGRLYRIRMKLRDMIGGELHG